MTYTEFDLGFVTESGIRLLLAALLGGAIGLEREVHDKPAGLRTHVLVCLGSALIMVISTSFGDGADPGRIAAQVVSGIGFLGAGTIIRRGNITVGLTTAASLWAVAGIGLAAGHPDLRFGILAAVAAAMVLVTLTAFYWLEARVFHRTINQVMTVTAFDTSVTIALVSEVIENLGVQSRGIRTERGSGGEPDRLEFELLTTHLRQPRQLIQQVSQLPGVESVRLEESRGTEDRGE